VAAAPAAAKPLAGPLGTAGTLATRSSTPVSLPAGSQPIKKSAQRRAERAQKRSLQAAQKREKRRQRAIEKNRLANAPQNKPAPAARDNEPNQAKANKKKPSAAREAAAPLPRNTLDKRNQIRGLALLLVGAALFFWFLSRHS
jgi:hypothetical protein